MRDDREYLYRLSQMALFGNLSASEADLDAYKKRMRGNRERAERAARLARKQLEEELVLYRPPAPPRKHVTCVHCWEEGQRAAAATSYENCGAPKMA